MKTQKQIENALTIKQKELEDLNLRIKDLQVWIDSSEEMRSENVFVAGVDERNSKERRQKELQIQITFLEWVLE